MKIISCSVFQCFPSVDIRRTDGGRGVGLGASLELKEHQAVMAINTRLGEFC